MIITSVDGTVRRQLIINLILWQIAYLFSIWLSGLISIRLLKDIVIYLFSGLFLIAPVWWMCFAIYQLISLTKMIKELEETE